MGNVENIKIEAMRVIFGEVVKQKEKITIRAGIVKSALAGRYFHTYAVVGGVIVKHVFWFNVTGTDLAPAITDATLHEVDISDVGIDTVAEIAAELQSVIDALAAIYSATVSGNVITVDHEVAGYAPSMHDAKNPAKVTNFGFEILVQGDSEDDLGCIDGEIEVAFEETFVDVNCHAEGTTPVAQLKTGVGNVEVTVNLEETTKAQMKKMFTKSGGSFIPDGGTEVFGMGTFKNFENMFKYATKLRLHPVRLLDGDRSEDWTFHKSVPNLEGLTFSGEEVFTLPVTFKVFPDATKDPRVNYFAIGDGSQSLA